MLAVGALFLLVVVFVCLVWVIAEIASLVIDIAGNLREWLE